MGAGLAEGGVVTTDPTSTSGVDGGPTVEQAAKSSADAGTLSKKSSAKAGSGGAPARPQGSSEPAPAPTTTSSPTPAMDSGHGGATTVMDAAVAPSCPGTAGPKMVAVTAPSGASYCIDSTEVTAGDYAAFLASNPALSLAPKGVCAFKKSFVPDGVFPPAAGTEVPVSSVDWCDAAAYCAYAGKRLCGKVGGGPNNYADFAKPSSEWFYACSAGGTSTYPYGAAFDPSACVGVDFDGTSGFQPTSDAPHPVGSASRCHGKTQPFSSVYDLTGNVAEWEDSCDSTSGSADYCHLRGDSYREGNQQTMSCAYAPRMTRSYRGGYIGFRCCS